MRAKAKRVSHSYAVLQGEAEALAKRTAAYSDDDDQQTLLDAGAHLALA